MFIKTMILVNGSRRKVVKLRKRETITKQLEACFSIAEHFGMEIQELKYN